MLNRLVSALAGGAFATIAVACSLTTNPPPDQNESDFCDDWAKAYCQIGSVCNFDVATCSAYQTGVCTTYVNGLLGGTRQYSQPNGHACIVALTGAYGGSPTSIQASILLQIQSTCSKVVAGNQGKGDSCTADNDCTGDLVCAKYNATTSICAVTTPKNAGDPCSDPGDQCQGDTYCATTMVPPICVATPPTGSACSTTIPCGSSDQCGDGDTCQPRGANGDPCAANGDCVSGYCDPYPPAQCEDGLQFSGRGILYDCEGVAGTDQPVDAGSGAASGDGGPGG